MRAGEVLAWVDLSLWSGGMTDSARTRLDDLAQIARQAMRERGLDPDMPPDVLREVAKVAGPADDRDSAARDLRQLPWASIDDDDSLDLDQLTVAQPGQNGQATILVAIADVDALVPQGSATDRHAQVNTLTVYTPGIIFPMLPERLSTNLTSLAAEQDRMAVVVEMQVGTDG